MSVLGTSEMRLDSVEERLSILEGGLSRRQGIGDYGRNALGTSYGPVDQPHVFSRDLPPDGPNDPPTGHVPDRARPASLRALRFPRRHDL